MPIYLVKDSGIIGDGFESLSRRVENPGVEENSVLVHDGLISASQMITVG